MVGGPSFVHCLAVSFRATRGGAVFRRTEAPRFRNSPTRSAASLGAGARCDRLGVHLPWKFQLSQDP